MYKIQQNCSIPNSCNLSCKMNDCISIGFLKSSIVQLSWKCCVKGANNQVEVQTTCSIVYLMGYWNTTVLKLFHWLENQWDIRLTILVIGRFFPVFWLQQRQPCEPIREQNSNPSAIGLDGIVLTLVTGCRKNLEKYCTHTPSWPILTLPLSGPSPITRMLAGFWSKKGIAYSTFRVIH